MGIEIDRASRDESAESDRTPRESQTREAQMAPASWRPPSMLPDPHPQEGWTFRWVRVATMSVSDATNASRQFREGYVPVKAVDHPELMLEANASGNIEVGGLLLCKIPTEVAKQRAAYYQKQAEQQMHAVDNNFMRENDPRMPLLRPERSSRVSFGTGSRE